MLQRNGSGPPLDASGQHSFSSISTHSLPSSPASPEQPGSWSPRSLREPTTPRTTTSALDSPQHSPRSEFAVRTGSSGARKKPIPSPLQQSSLAFSAQRGTIGSPRSAQFPAPPYHDGPRSPREKLDALLAEEDCPSPAAPTSTQHQQAPVDAASARLPAHAARLRNGSAPLPSTAVAPPPSSPPTMPPPSRPSRPETRPTAPRNNSLDSQASSLSSISQPQSQPNRPPPGHQHKASSASQDGAANPPDMAALIQAAGSPEAALMNMWREKQSASNHNAQLWRLVEKQRAMIIGLNKDLERALNDKNRYRKKLKEYVNQVPPVPGAPQRSDTIDSVARGETPSPAPSERQDEGTPVQPLSRATEHRGSPLTQGTTARQQPPNTESPLAQSPPSSAGTRTASNPSSAVQSDTDYAAQAARTGLGLDSVTQSSSSAVQSDVRPASAEEQAQKKSGASSKPAVALHAPSLSVTHATPVIGGEGFESSPKPPLRKPPPAPLNLSNAKTSAHLHEAVRTEQSDEEYDDTLEIDEIPIVERGRRKTREDDDRVREEKAIQEEEARSKSKKSKSKSKPPAEEPAEDEQAAMPSASPSARLAAPPAAGLPISPRHPPANSLNALLSPANSDASMMANRGLASPALMSPGLPQSPRPGDRPLGSPLPRSPRPGLASPPMSPRSGANGVQPRPPRQPIPLPPNTPQSFVSPQPPAQAKQGSSDFLRPPNAQPSPVSDSQMSDGSETANIYRGYVSEQYPGLLLPPNALPSIDVKVFSSRLRPSRMSYMAPKPQEEDPVFILAIYARSNGQQLWRVEKTIMALPALDMRLKSLSEFSGRLPDRALFTGHAPAKMDARRAALNHYFDVMLETPMSEKAALVICEFFSTDVIGADKDDIPGSSPVALHSPGIKPKLPKEGYLTKRGKNFGGWKARYFVLDGPEFKYYEMPGGAHLGTIRLINAQIGKQSQHQANQSPQRRDDSEDNQYRHAFLILEPKRKDSSSLVRHVLCAESDEERDAWVEALLHFTDPHDDSSPTESQASSTRLTRGQPSDQQSKKDSSPDSERTTRLQAIGYEETVAAEAPVVLGPNNRGNKDAHSSPKSSGFGHENGHPVISAPTNGAPIQNLEMWGHKTAPTSVKDKKRSIFGFRGKPSDLAPQQPAQQPQFVQPARNVFGIPLQEAVEISQPGGVNVQLPAVVYRCIEYLKGKKAYQEEGIFRLSGSNIVIKGLRDRFNNEGDVRLLSGDYYDVHAVASLLKLYLRELPASILTRELHIDFLKVLGKLIKLF